MGMFVQEDHEYNEIDRQVGFNRYKQLISRHFTDWLSLNLVTLAGAIPLAVGILFAMGSSSVLLLIPCSLIGGMIFGPFLAGLYDALLRAMRDDPLPWSKNYKKSWKQNFKSSLLPGALLGLMIGFFAFMGMLFWMAQIPPTPATVLLLLFSAMITLIVTQLYFTQMVLFTQSAGVRLRNILLFVIKYPGRVLLTGVLQVFYWIILFLFAPWTLLLLPITGIWYIVYMTELILYSRLDEAFLIEEQFELAATKGDS